LEDKALPIKDISLDRVMKGLKISTTINTAPFKITIIAKTILIVSNDALHKYQTDKIIVESFPLPVQDISAS
jgi:hypothetical protein